MTKRIVAITLLLMLCLTSLFSCENTPGGTSETASSPDTESTVSGGSDALYKADTKGVDYDGETVTILTTIWEPDTYKWFEFADVREGLESSVINDAAHQRKLKVEELLNCILTEQCVDRGAEEASAAIRSLIDSGVGDYQIVAPDILEGSVLAQEGCFYDLLSVENMNRCSDPWWDEKFCEGMTVKGSLYYAAGDIGCRTYDNLAILMFNKEMFEELELENPYDLVRSRKFTLDKVKTWSRMVRQDIDENGTMDYNDKFGYGGLVDDVLNLFYGCGGLSTLQTAEGDYVNNLGSQQSVNIAMSVLDMLQNKEYFLNANDYFGAPGYVVTPSELVIKAFMENRCLLYDGYTSAIEDMREMDTDFGLLPHPLYDENQEEYYTYVSIWGAAGYAIPVSQTEEEAERTAVLMNVLGAEGKNTLMPAYYETCLKGQRTRDDESQEMLDIVFNSMQTDFGCMFIWEEVARGVLFTAFSSTPGTYVSVVDGRASVVENAIEKVLTNFEDLND